MEERVPNDEALRGSSGRISTASMPPSAYQEFAQVRSSDVVPPERVLSSAAASTYAMTYRMSLVAAEPYLKISHAAIFSTRTGLLILRYRGHVIALVLGIAMMCSGDNFALRFSAIILWVCGLVPWMHSQNRFIAWRNLTSLRGVLTMYFGCAAGAAAVRDSLESDVHVALAIATAMGVVMGAYITASGDAMQQGSKAAIYMIVLLGWFTTYVLEHISTKWENVEMCTWVMCTTTQKKLI
jgi:hypothetical protein